MRGGTCVLCGVVRVFYAGWYVCFMRGGACVLCGVVRVFYAGWYVCCMRGGTCVLCGVVRAFYAGWCVCFMRGGTYVSVEGTSSVNQTELFLTRPSPHAVHSALREAGLVLTDNQHRPIHFQPYGRNTQVLLPAEDWW